MASLKIASLFLRTLSKPIANKIKQQAKEHEGFKTRTVRMAQWLHRAEMNLRVRLLGESPKHVRPLSEARAIDAGANFLSEGFLFSVAATIILGETYRSRRAESVRRDAIKDALSAHDQELEALRAEVKKEREERREEQGRERELEKVVEEIVLIGLHGGFGDPLASSPDWQRHLRVGQLAREFGTAGRALREEEDEDEREEPSRTGGEEEGLKNVGEAVRERIEEKGEGKEEEKEGEKEGEGENEHKAAVETSIEAEEKGKQGSMEKKP
ncbi:hypothetical protein JCM8547_000693 [Rhodosporidiobolus lusitaniae]